MLRRALRGVVLDLDGTLRVPPSRDLGALRRMVLGGRHGLPPQQVQQALESIDSAQRQQAYSSAIPGAKELCDLIDLLELRRGMITSSSSTADAEKFQAELDTRAPFSPILAWEQPALDPSPDLLLQVCRQWGVEPQQVLMVGASPRHGIACGNSAGALTCLVDPLFRHCSLHPLLPPHHRPTFTVHSLHELKLLLANNLASAQTTVQPRLPSHPRTTRGQTSSQH